MFTGIITDVGRIVAVEARGDLRLRIACGYDLGKVDLGASGRTAESPVRRNRTDRS